MLLQRNSTFKSQILALGSLFKDKEYISLVLCIYGLTHKYSMSFTKCSFGHLLLQAKMFSHEKFKKHRNIKREKLSPFSLAFSYFTTINTLIYS